MSKTICCEKCGTTLIVAEKGSKIKNGLKVLCSACWEKLEMADFAMRNKYPQNPFKDIFGDIFNGK